MRHVLAWLGSRAACLPAIQRRLEAVEGAFKMTRHRHSCCSRTASKPCSSRRHQLPRHIQHLRLAHTASALAPATGGLPSRDVSLFPNISTHIDRSWPPSSQELQLSLDHQHRHLAMVPASPHARKIFTVFRLSALSCFGAHKGRLSDKPWHPHAERLAVQLKV